MFTALIFISELCLTALVLSSCGVAFSLRVPQSAPQIVDNSHNFIAPKASLEESEVAILVNDDDPQSVAVANYYQTHRNIPSKNVIHLRFATGVDALAAAEFAPLKAQVDAALGPEIQALALTWTRPYLVQCMSITSAFSFGFDLKYCNTTAGCAHTAVSPYYDQETVQPYGSFGIRPSMMLAGANAANVFSLIDRSIAAENTFPHGTGYLIRTSDVDRSTRFPEFVTLSQNWNPQTGIRMTYLDNSGGAIQDTITNKTDVMFYFTGLASVPGITSNIFKPGAVADHLTSFGGQVPTSSQMSAVSWLEAGASASYGTVVEPCNYVEKFPNPNLMTRYYFRGGSAVEAYWKSVKEPGEGLFVGDPLTRPFSKPIISFIDGALVIQTSWMRPGLIYRLQAAEKVDGIWSTIDDNLTTPREQLNRFVIPSPQHRYYRIVTP